MLVDPTTAVSSRWRGEGSSQCRPGRASCFAPSLQLYNVAQKRASRGILSCPSLSSSKPEVLRSAVHLEDPASRGCI